MPWVDDLTDKITEMLADSKQVRFNTHKNRKIFTAKLVELVKNTIKTNISEHSEHINVRQIAITRPNPKPSQGHSVMTAELAAKGDDILNKVNSQKNSNVAITSN